MVLYGHRYAICGTQDIHKEQLKLKQWVLLALEDLFLPLLFLMPNGGLFETILDGLKIAHHFRCI